ncbi:MAG TPA: ABC transporter permease [Chloroflexota bacterium]|nr:ABC transporter permease [Chloroflexota bacterium]
MADESRLGAVSRVGTSVGTLETAVPRPSDDSGDVLAVPLSPMRQAFIRFRRNRLAVASLIFLLALLVLTCIAQWLPLIDPTVPDPANTDAWPSAQHLLGTDGNGHDLFSAMIYGLRPAFVVGIVGAVVTTILGVSMGLAAGFLSGWVDALLSRFTDLMFAFPALVLALLCEELFTNSNSPVGNALGDQARVIVMTVVFALLGWPALMRFVRGLTLQYKEMQFVEAARALGLSNWGIVLRHLLPNTWGLVLVQATFTVGGFIYTEIVLSLLGLGVQVPTPDLGYLANQALADLEINWVETVAPSALLTLLIVAFAFLGDGLRDAFDPQTRES